MAKLRFKIKDVEHHFKLDDVMLEKINLFGTPAEKVGDELEIEVFPNRPDLISLQGFVRAMRAFTGKQKGITHYKVVSSGLTVRAEKSLPSEWPYACACIIKGLKLNDQNVRDIIQIQEKLGATLLRNRRKGGIGLYPLQKITFPVTFKGLSPEKITFRPLDYPSEITAKQILAKHSTGREYAPIIEGWKTFPVFVDSKNVIMSMPPILNSHTVGRIDATTNDVFVECTGNDLNAIKLALTIMVTSLAEMGGAIHSVECVQQDGTREKIPDLSDTIHSLSLERVNAMLGLSLKEKDVQEACARMQLDYKGKKVYVPCWRNDVLHEVDLIEDVAIGYGYENISPTLPVIATIGEENLESIIHKRCVEALVGLGFIETSSMHLITLDEANKLGIKKSLSVESARTEYSLLRPHLLGPLLRTYAQNTDAEYPQKLCEVGTVFKENVNVYTGIDEKTHLAMGLSPGNYTSMKQTLDYLASMIGFTFAVQEASQEGFIEGRYVSILHDKKIIGYLGEIHPDTLNDWKIKMPLAIAEIDLGEITRTLLKKK